MEKEIWKPIKGYERYYKISNLGRIYGVKNRKIKIPTLGERGYYEIGLWCNNKRKTLKIHQLIAKHFIENPRKLTCINHIDGNKLNNSINNLEWVTILENNKHSRENGLNKDIGSTHHNSILNEYDIILIRNIKHLRSSQIAKLFNVTSSNINLIINFKRWKHVK